MLLHKICICTLYVFLVSAIPPEVVTVTATEKGDMLFFKFDQNVSQIFTSESRIPKLLSLIDSLVWKQG